MNFYQYVEGDALIVPGALINKRKLANPLQSNTHVIREIVGFLQGNTHITKLSLKWAGTDAKDTKELS